MADCDPTNNWCTQHSNGARGSSIWHDLCARVQACKLAAWWRKCMSHLPTPFQVNGQRLIWQKRCDRLLNMILCESCINEKDEAFEEGRGMDYRPNWDGKCRLVACIMEQNVTCPQRYEDLSYNDEKVETMWAFVPRCDPHK